MKKKIVSVLLSIVLIISVLTPAFAFAKSSTPIWDKYSESGKYKVSTLTFTLPENDYTYKVWYPRDIASMPKRPIILYCNGTGSNYIKTPDTVTYLKKAASYGYVCLTNTDENTGVGTSMNEGMNALIAFNSKKSHKFYKKLDINKVGLAGHSQGAACCINLASKGKYSNNKYFKTIFACSLPSPQLEASELQNCPYDPSLVSIPTLLVSGTGITDSAFIAPIERSMLPAFRSIKSDVVAARMKGVEHADSIYQTHPYMIAWFDYKLCGNKEAAKAFTGKASELETNKKWQDYRIKINCPAISLSKVTAGKKSFKASWKVLGNTTGYQLQYSTSKSFKKGTNKSILISDKKAAAKTVKKLKSKKTYYVRIRTYRSVSSVKYYGKWSAAKKIKTK